MDLAVPASGYMSHGASIVVTAPVGDGRNS
jgi:hypothetical protein